MSEGADADAMPIIEEEELVDPIQLPLFLEKVSDL